MLGGGAGAGGQGWGGGQENREGGHVRVREGVGGDGAFWDRGGEMYVLGWGMRCRAGEVGDGGGTEMEVHVTVRGLVNPQCSRGDGEGRGV